MLAAVCCARTPCVHRHIGRFLSLGRQDVVRWPEPCTKFQRCAVSSVLARAASNIVADPYSVQQLRPIEPGPAVALSSPPEVWPP